MHRVRLDYFGFVRSSHVESKRRHPLSCVCHHNKGFTLLELLVVIAIIGLLAAYVAPRYFQQIGKSERSAALAQVQSFERALDAYRLDIGYYPSAESGLQALVMRPASEMKWNGPYLQKAPPLDPWGNPFVYRMPGERYEFEVLSLGKDGRPGGDGDAADIVSR